MMNQVMQRPLFRQQGSPMGGEQAFMQYLQTTLSPEQLQSLMQNPNRDQIIGQLYEKFMTEQQQVQSSPIAMRKEGSSNTGEMSVPSFLQFNILDRLGVIDNSSLNREVPDKSYKINLDDAMTNPQLLDTVFEMITESTGFDLGAFMNMGRSQQEDYIKDIKGKLIFDNRAREISMGNKEEELNPMLIGETTSNSNPRFVGPQKMDMRPFYDKDGALTLSTDQMGMFQANQPGGIAVKRAEGGEMKAVGIADGLDQEEPMSVDRDPSNEGIAKVSPDQYVSLMNEVRGDEVSMEGRVQELAGVVGEQDATDTPLSVLALVQPIFELQEQKQQQGITNAPQGQEMMAQGPMPMANGGIVYRSMGTPNLGESTRKYYQQLQGIFPEYGAMKSASLYTPTIKAGLRIAEGAPLTGEGGVISETLTDYTNLLPKLATADTPLKQSALKLASDDLTATKAAAAKKLEYDRDLAKAVLLKKMEQESKKVQTVGVVGGDNTKLTKDLFDLTGTEIDLSSFTEGSVIQIKPTGELKITKAPTQDKTEYSVTYPVTIGKGDEATQSTKTEIIDISTPEGIERFNVLQNKKLNSDDAGKSLFKFEKLSGMNFSPDMEFNINPIIPKKDGGMVYRETGSTEEGEKSEEVIGVTDQFTEQFNLNKEQPQYIEGGTYPELAKGKIEQAELAMKDIATLYEKAFNNPLYVGIMGSGARTGKSIFGAIDDIFNSFGYNINLPGEDFFFAPIVSEIKQAETNIATAVAAVRRTQTGRSNQAREINLVKNDLDITGLNSAQGTLDSLKGIWLEMANKANAQRALVPGLDPIEYKEPEVFSKVRGTNEKQLGDQKFDLIINLLPPELKEMSMNDPDIKNAINAVVEGADPQLVIERLKELKGIE